MHTDFFDLEWFRSRTEAALAHVEGLRSDDANLEVLELQVGLREKTEAEHHYVASRTRE